MPSIGPSLPFPYSEGAVVHLSENAAHRLRRAWVAADVTDPVPLNEVIANRVAILPNGWVRIFHSYLAANDRMQYVDALLAPGEVVAIYTQWNEDDVPRGFTWAEKVDLDERGRLHDASWGIDREGQITSAFDFGSSGAGDPK